MHMFDVPKGEDDIRLVYDGTKSGLNNYLWSSWFSLPTVDTMTKSIVAGTWSADDDFADQFLNFYLHPSLRSYCGIDLSRLFPELLDESGECYAVWTRNAMGLKPSPYASVQAAMRAKLEFVGDKDEVTNPFQWDHWLFNLPGHKDYNLTLPWMYKVRRDGHVAVYVHMYVDDLRITEPTLELAWDASAKVAKICSWLGLQDVARKRQEPSCKPGA
mmetsp:Transcript_13380/g.19135  ORF Transcript_13380/g.19135 Transcript_13380/m.19135 type:complete len:216 (-) Transcript_13380:2741-3388(-)